jgi:hypothetical protein
MVMTIGWIGLLLAADATVVTGVRVAAGVAELVSLAAGHRVTRLVAVPMATTAAAVMAIFRRLCLRVRPRWEAALPPGLGRSARLSMDVDGLVGRHCRSKMSLC